MGVYLSMACVINKQREVLLTFQPSYEIEREINVTFVIDKNDKAMARVPFTDNNFLAKAREAVLQYARKHHGNESPEDLTQEALARVFEKIKSGNLTKLTCSFKTYVINVLKNVAREQRREAVHSAESNRPTDEDEEDNVLTPVDMGMTQEAIKRWLDNDSEQEHEELQQAAHDIVVNMPDPCKTILWAYYWEGKNMREIAAAMNYNNARVATTQKSRCLTKVRIAMNNIFNK